MPMHIVAQKTYVGVKANNNKIVVVWRLMKWEEFIIFLPVQQYYQKRY